MRLENFEGRCASSVSPSAIWAFLYNFLCPVGQCNLQEKCEYHRALSKYFCLYFLIDPIFILQIFVSALDAFQKVMRYGFKLPFHADDDAKRIQTVNFKHGKKRAESTWSSCSASGWCAEFVDVAKQIVKTASLSSTQQVALGCICFRFLFAKASDSACGQNP